MGGGCSPSQRKFFECKKDILHILGYLKVATVGIVFFLKYAICLTLTECQNMNWSVNVHKDKEDVLACGSHMGMEL